MGVTPAAGITCANSMLQRSGNWLSISKMLPHFSSWIFSMSSTKITACGFPIETVSAVKSKLSAVSLIEPKKFLGSPISTHTRPSSKSAGFTRPLLVCRLKTLVLSSFARPRLRMYFATQRVALPHMAASEPSALKMRISKSTPFGTDFAAGPTPAPTPVSPSTRQPSLSIGVTITTPSAPIPKRRSQSLITLSVKAAPYSGVCPGS